MFDLLLLFLEKFGIDEERDQQKTSLIEQTSESGIAVVRWAHFSLASLQKIELEMNHRWISSVRYAINQHWFDIPVIKTCSMPTSIFTFRFWNPRILTDFVENSEVRGKVKNKDLSRDLIGWESSQTWDVAILRAWLWNRFCGLSICWARFRFSFLLPSHLWLWKN